MMSAASLPALFATLSSHLPVSLSGGTLPVSSPPNGVEPAQKASSCCASSTDSSVAAMAARLVAGMPPTVFVLAVNFAMASFSQASSPESSTIFFASARAMWHLMIDAASLPVAFATPSSHLAMAVLDGRQPLSSLPKALPVGVCAQPPNASHWSVVQASWSSVQGDPAVSSVQFALQQSPGAWLPSSRCSLPSSTPLPHAHGIVDGSVTTVPLLLCGVSESLHAKSAALLLVLVPRCSECPTPARVVGVPVWMLAGP